MPHHKPTIRELSDDEQTAITEAVAELARQDSRVSSSIVCMDLRDDGSVDVRTGFLHNPRYGSGHKLKAVLVDGKWQLTNLGGWMA
jgi:hypothetical protein